MTKASSTLCYMPPEVLVDNPFYNTTTDCFSFGVLVIHTLCAKWPLPGPPTRVSDSDKLQALTEFERRKRYVLLIGLYHPLMELIRRCLENNCKFRANSLTIVREIVDIQVSIQYIHLTMCGSMHTGPACLWLPVSKDFMQKVGCEHTPYTSPGCMGFKLAVTCVHDV